MKFVSEGTKIVDILEQHDDLRQGRAEFVPTFGFSPLPRADQRYGVARDCCTPTTSPPMS